MNSIEALKKLSIQCLISNDIDGKCFEELSIIEEDLEVLEILKNKNVDVDLIKNLMKDNRKFECYPDDNLTQEEFELVKEWIENE